MQTLPPDPAENPTSHKKTASLEKAFVAEKHVSAVRMAIVIFNSLVYVFLLDPSQSIHWLAQVIIMAALLYSLWVHILQPYRRYPIMLSSYFTSITDTLLITCWVYATGGISSPFHVIWYVAITSIAFRYSFRETIVAAIIYSLSYVILMSLLGHMASHLTDIIVRIGYIFFVGIIGALFAQEALLQIKTKLEFQALTQHLARETQERQQATEKLERSLARLQATLEATADGILAVDRAGKVEGFNQQYLDIWRIPPSVVASGNDEQVLTLVRDQLKDPEPFLTRIRSIYEQPGARRVEMLELKDGRFIECHLKPQRIKGEQVGRVWSFRDITELKQAEEQAMQLVVEKERMNILANFVTNASHDFRTPLATIYMSLYLFRKTSEPEQQARYLNMIERQAARLTELVDGLFTLTQLDSGKELIFVPLQLNQLVQAVEATTQPIIASKDLQMVLGLAEGLPPVLGDAERLTQALLKIVENAGNYSTASGTVTISTYARDAFVVIEVRDTGVGISAEDLPYIFDRFYRVDKARSTETGGIGLGLSITKKIVEMHGGRIEVESEPGQGSTFYVYLPISQQAADTGT